MRMTEYAVVGRTASDIEGRKNSRRKKEPIDRCVEIDMRLKTSLIKTGVGKSFLPIAILARKSNSLYETQFLFFRRYSCREREREREREERRI